MERVAFIIDSTGERLTALLNPDHVKVRRTAGVRRRRMPGGILTGTGLTDDPLLYTGGGTTQIELQLLFDVTLPGSTVQTNNVRELTSALWNLAENQDASSRYGRPPTVLFVWGKTWLFPGVITAVAERLESFDATGAPRRSWLSMRMTRVVQPAALETEAAPSPDLSNLPYTPTDLPAADSLGHEVLGSGANGSSATGERVDEIAWSHYRNSGFWRFLAWDNDLDDPGRLEPGTVLRIRPRDAIEEKR